MKNQENTARKPTENTNNSNCIMGRTNPEIASRRSSDRDAYSWASRCFTSSDRSTI